VIDYPILQHFTYEHLPEHLQAVSKPFCLLAREMAASLPGGPETSAGLRKLLEAKDCAVVNRRNFISATLAAIGAALVPAFRLPGNDLARGGVFKLRPEADRFHCGPVESITHIEIDGNPIENIPKALQSSSKERIRAGWKLGSVEARA